MLQALHHQHATGWLGLNMTMAQVRAMITLSQGESMPIGTLAELLGIGISAASQLVERLVEQGLVERREDRQDRRRMLIPFSPGTGAGQPVSIEVPRRSFAPGSRG